MFDELLEEILPGRVEAKHRPAGATFTVCRRPDPPGLLMAPFVDVRETIDEACSNIIDEIQETLSKLYGGETPTRPPADVAMVFTARQAGPDLRIRGYCFQDRADFDAVVAAVYNGDCDAGATYVDARSAIEDDNPDVMDVVAVIHTSVDIPNDGLQFAPSVDEELRTQIVDALLKIAETEEGQEALDTAYSWTALEKHGDEFYDGFRQLLDAAGVDVEALQE